MFTGIVQAQGLVLANEAKGAAKQLMLQTDFKDLIPGESIAVNGVCLTWLPTKTDQLTFDVSSETLSLTNLGALIPGQSVNLERAMTAAMRFGGHYVTGHIDTRVFLQEVSWQEEYLALTVAGFKPSEQLYLLPKGSITVDGVSLTINAVHQQTIQLLLIPHTLALTHFKTAKAGQIVNIEFDYMTRIIAHQLQMIGQLQKEVEP